jgi:predicted phage-related endonuclease
VKPEMLRLEQRERGSYLGGSEVAAVLGIPGAWGTPFEVWAKRQPEYQQEEDKPSEMLEAGNRFELTVASWVADKIGGKYVAGEPYTGKVVVGPEPWMACHPDGYMLIDGVWHVYEGKVAGRSGHLFGSAGLMPEKYLCQWVYQQHLTKMPGQFGAQRSLSEGPWTHRMERNPQLEDAIVNQLGEWWHQHIIKGTMPEIDGGKAAHSFLQQKHADHGMDIREATADERGLIAGLADAKRLKTAVDADIKRLEAQVKDAIGADMGLEMPDGGKVTWKSQGGSKRLDTRALRADHPEIADKYTKQGKPSRVLRASPIWSKL